jgi:hypothetical protein
MGVSKDKPIQPSLFDQEPPQPPQDDPRPVPEPVSTWQATADELRDRQSYATLSEYLAGVR